MAPSVRALVGSLLAVTLCQMHSASAVQPLRILFIGNSITYYNSGLDVVRGQAHVQLSSLTHLCLQQ